MLNEYSVALISGFEQFKLSGKVYLTATNLCISFRFLHASCSQYPCEAIILRLASNLDIREDALICPCSHINAGKCVRAVLMKDECCDHMRSLVAW